jgi:hypothetical protein
MGKERKGGDVTIRRPFWPISGDRELLSGAQAGFLLLYGGRLPFIFHSNISIAPCIWSSVLLCTGCVLAMAPT